MTIDFVFDFESMGYPPDCAITNIAAVVFENNPYKVPTFKELVDAAFYMKLDYLNQGRKLDRGVVEWWQRQPAEARSVLRRTGEEKTINEMVQGFSEYLESNGYKKKTGIGWCRGQSFDFPILVDAIRQANQTRDTFDLEPCFFWNQRDVRTAIEGTLMVRGQTTCPLPNGVLEGFVKHNPIHDVAKAVLELIYSQRYALGLEECPSEQDADPLSI